MRCGLRWVQKEVGREKSFEVGRTGSCGRAARSCDAGDSCEPASTGQPSAADLHDQRRRPQPEGQRVVPRLLPAGRSRFTRATRSSSTTSASASRTRSRSARSPTTRSRTTTRSDARSSRSRTTPPAVPADRRAAAVALPARARRCGPVGREPLLPAERRRRAPRPARTASTSSPPSTARSRTTTRGWLKNNEKFTVHLSSGTSPGTYRFMCLLHREDMAGKITVVSVGEDGHEPAPRSSRSARSSSPPPRRRSSRPAALLAKGPAADPAPDAARREPGARRARAPNEHLRRDRPVRAAGRQHPGRRLGHLVARRRPLDHVQLEQEQTTTSSRSRPTAPSHMNAEGALAGRRPGRAAALERRPDERHSTSRSSPPRPGTARASTTPASSPTRSGRR